jgi:hypothetical protein
MVGEENFEISTSRTQTARSSAELFSVEPLRGLEPPTLRVETVDSNPLSYRGMVLADGVEPPTTSLSERYSAAELSQLGTPPRIRTETGTVLSRFPLPVGIEELGELDWIRTSTLTLLRRLCLPIAPQALVPSTGVEPVKPSF